MTTITERIEYASAAAHDFAETATEQVFSLANIEDAVSDVKVCKDHSTLIAALIEAAVKTYATERQYEAAELIADSLRDIVAIIREGVQS
jgi:hypothetical protein